VIIDGSASYPSIPSGTSADSIAPHFTAYIPSGAACGGSVSFDISVTSDQGTWSGGSISHPVGLVILGGGTALNETFSGGIPATWTVVDGGSGGGAAATWTTANPGGRTIAPPMAAPTAIIDSDNAGSATGVTQDEQLITPLIDLSAATTAALDFDEYFHYYVNGQAEVGDVDVRSTATAGAWVNVLRHTSEGTNPAHQTINITAQAAGAADVQVRFHYYNGHYEWWWQVDNVKVTYTAPGGCSMPVCSAPAPGVARAVSEGMTAGRVDAALASISVAWSVTCASTDYHLLYGDLASVATTTPTGSVCDLGTSGTASWTNVPAGSLWFVVVGDDNVVTEGSWGQATAGERGGTTASGQCSITTRDNSGTCP
jgi:hypothetical protein